MMGRRNLVHLRACLLAVFLVLVLLWGTGCGGVRTQQVESKTALSGAEKALADISKLPARERQAKLEEEAKKEGKLVFYGSIQEAEAEKFFKAFEGKYPFLKVEYSRATTEAILDKVLSETQAGQHRVDALQVTMTPLQVLLKEGNIIGKYESPHRAEIPSDYQDQDGYWTIMYNVIEGMAYNTQKVSAAEAPKTWTDLLDPKWKGKIGLPLSEARWAKAMLDTMGETEGMDFLNKLSQQDVLMANNPSSLAQALSVGEVSIAAEMHVSTIGPIKAKGAPVDYMVPKDPLYMIGTVATLYKNAPHPYAAALFIDYVLSKEGQEVLATAGKKNGPRTDVKYPYEDVFAGVKKVLVIDNITPEDYTKYQQLFEKLFIRKQ